ncbi:MAG TPA: nitrite/sulfite reductase [Bryobacteraceae bacterium]|nr:nitrite/sulfite reductase [Bryobacteraceae bacterium]
MLQNPNLVTRPEVEAEFDATVREDIEKFRAAATGFQAGELTDDQFRAQRLRRGVYSQRQPGVHMIRTKIPGGILTADQMDVLAAVSEEFAENKGHLTTRQNMQYHFIPLPKVADLLHRLADARLTTREACYNTVRNVTASPLSGLLANEVFDVQPYVRMTALAFLHNELTDSLPRKFKIAFFSGGEKDDMALAIHDFGATAVIKDGQKGFRTVIGGGLGPLPNEAALLDEFLPEEKLIARIESVIRLFSQYGNRQNRNKARLKFVLRERGLDWVKETIEANYADILANGGTLTPQVVPESFGGYRSVEPPLGTGELLPVLGATPADPEFDRWLETNVREQKQTGYSIVTVRLPQGNLDAAQMRALAKLSRDAGDSIVRVDIDQNVHLAYIPVHSLRRVFAALKVAGLALAGAGELVDTVSCPGAYSCNLALTKSMNLAAAVSEAVSSYTDKQVRGLSVKISGCPNSCGQHWLGSLGFYGNSRKVEGKEVPYYQMMLGGGHDKDGILRFGLAISSLPAKLAPVAARRVLDHFLESREAGESFREYVLRHKVEFFRKMVADLAKPAAYEPEWFMDWGDRESYSLQLGRGECAS